jgi:hypothetical protein
VPAGPRPARTGPGTASEPDGELIAGAAVRDVLSWPVPPTLDVGEITDKGLLNRRRLLASRAAPVELLEA